MTGHDDSAKNATKSRHAAAVGRLLGGGPLRFSEGVNLAVHALGYLARHGGGPVTAPHIADVMKASRDHLKKILQRLTKVGLVSSQRGPRGGFTLTLPPKDVTLLVVIEAIEGPWQVPHCVFGGSICGEECVLHDVTDRVHANLYKSLSTLTLADLPRVTS